MLGLIGVAARAARSGYQPGPPPARRKRNYTPAQARLRLACGLAWILFITIGLLVWKWTP